MVAKFYFKCVRYLSYSCIRNVVLSYSFHLVLFTILVSINGKIMIYSMIVFDSIACQIVVSDPSFWCSNAGNVALEEECEETIGVQPGGQEWQPNDVM